MRRFSLFPLNGIFRVQFYNPETRKYGTAKSTGKKDRDEAVLVVGEWLRDGIPTGRTRKPRSLKEFFSLMTILENIRQARLTTDDAGRIVEALKEKGFIEIAIVEAGPASELIEDFLSRFWNYDESPYVREKLAHGHSIHRRHCYEMTVRARKYWFVYFKGKRLGEIRKSNLKDFSLWLAAKKLAPKSINTILSARTVPLGWAFKNELIPSNPGEGLMKFSGPPAKRGILTDEEATGLFKVKWTDERSRVGNRLSMTTGLRAGEVLGLPLKNIGEDRLYIRQSWSDKDGLKTTKTNEERIVPIHPIIREELLKLGEMNPHGSGPDSFVFYSESMKERPMDFHFLRDCLRDALVLMTAGENTTEEEKKEAAQAWKVRKVTFHSWRHDFSTRMADQINPRKVKLATGHSSEEMFQHYANHAEEKDFLEVGRVSGETFGRILNFSKAAKERE